MVHLDRIGRFFLKCCNDHIVTIDSHTQGEPTRLIVGGIDRLGGETMREKREEFARKFDQVRLLLTREPRGHRDMFAAAVTEPVTERAHFGLIYMDAQRYPYLCGHATIGAVTTLIETGALSVGEGENPITVDTPSGPVEALASVVGGRVMSVALDMVPSFVLGTGHRLDVPNYKAITVDLVCVGGFFAMVAAEEIDVPLTVDHSRFLTSLGMEIIEAANRQLAVHHPLRPEVKTVDVVEFYDESTESGSGSSVVIYGKSHMDRSPCGTGTSAKMTLLHHRGKLSPGTQYRNYSLLGTCFRGSLRESDHIGSFPAVIARVEGNAQITGYHQFTLDDRDPFPQGFLS
ncbi:MAG: proline racemase family protein [Desulforhopalus sp.]